MHAVRNIRLCTKDCLCLYVCPTGATDTETGQIDAAKCLDGCHACVDARPSHAISLVPEVYPPQQEKSNTVKNSLLSIADNKAKQEKIAKNTAENTKDPVLKQLAFAYEKSNRLMAEDLIREAGFMLPQSENVIEFLNGLLLKEKSEDFPRNSVEKLIKLLDQEN